MSSSIVTYTFVYSDSEPWRFQWVSDVEPEAPEEAPQSLEQAPPSPNYVPGPEHPPSPDYVPGPKYPEYLVPPDDEVPIEDQPLPTNASPTALSSGYAADSDPSEEDLADYPTNEGDDEEESSEDDDDEEKDEAFEEDEEEEEHLASADSTTLPAIDLVPLAEDTEAFETDESAPTPTPSPLSPLSSLLLRIPSPPTHTSPTYAKAPLGYKAAMADMPLRKRAHFSTPTSGFKVRESSAAAAARHVRHALTSSVDYEFIDTVDASISASESRAMTAIGEAWSRLEDRSTALEASIRTLERLETEHASEMQDPRMGQLMLVVVVSVVPLLAILYSLLSFMVILKKIPPKKTTTTPMTDVAIKTLIAQGVSDALAEYEAHRSSGNGDDSHDSGSGRRIERATRECTYSDFLKCQPLSFKGTEGVGNALTWWNSHVKTVSHEVAYGMTWKTLKKMMTDKYYPRGEIKKPEIELMFPEESDEVKKYVGGLPDIIQRSVMASKPKTMQDAIEFATELMDQKIRTFADRQAENKRKLNDNSRNNHNQQQPFKKRTPDKTCRTSSSIRLESNSTTMVQNREGNRDADTSKAHNNIQYISPHCVKHQRYLFKCSAM
ncbi:hypothetical protein Tco_0876234 [Tanacetum coccineum]|uniref:Retrotransposon gag domain-containing protein n=1 Tax=Tanacetum coccineum TaxID=301880 RepID=A0ABQ5BT88_9ASTR